MGALVAMLVVAGVAPRARADEPAPEKKIKLAVFDVHAQGIDPATAQTTTDVLAVELGKVPDLEVVTDAQVQSLLKKGETTGIKGFVKDGAKVNGRLKLDADAALFLEQ